VYFCRCGTNVAEKIDGDAVAHAVERAPGPAYCQSHDFLCSESGVEWMAKDIAEHGPDRVVVAACSVRDHEETFRKVLSGAGLNPYLMQMVNIREHIAWVTDEAALATEKACLAVGAAMARVRLHEPLERREIDICPDVLVIGAGPAGLKAALAVAESGRKAVVVERGPILGGLSVKCEEIFPNLECGPCMVEPVLADAMHGAHAENIELLTMAEVEEVVGYYGNFTAKIAQQPRYVSTSLCIGCYECVGPCPVSTVNPHNAGLGTRKAMDFAFQGGLPNAPYIDPAACTRLSGVDECDACLKACPVDGAVVFDDRRRVVGRQVGAILMATGGDLYDCSRLPSLGYGRLDDVYTSLEFERVLASTGPTAGAIVRKDGRAPERVAVVHCVGSLDPEHKSYCSAVCCQSAFKYNAMIAHKLEGVEVVHYYKALSIPGKSESKLYDQACRRETTTMVHVDDINRMRVDATPDGRYTVTPARVNGSAPQAPFDMVILCPALVASAGTGRVAKVLDLPLDRDGFVEELHNRMDAARTKIRGIYAAGTCRAPMDTQHAVNEALAATGYMLAGLVPGRRLPVDPVTATVDAARCSACRTCIPVCPYKAISHDATGNAAFVNQVLCAGCGTCVAACPTGAITGHHFTNDQIVAEIVGVLS
jgi:heterodisulfide reductase subunit A